MTRGNLLGNRAASIGDTAQIKCHSVSAHAGSDHIIAVPDKVGERASEIYVPVVVRTELEHIVCGSECDITGPDEEIGRR